VSRLLGLLLGIFVVFMLWQEGDFDQWFLGLSGLLRPFLTIAFHALLVIGEVLLGLGAIALLIWLIWWLCFDKRYPADDAPAVYPLLRPTPPSRVYEYCDSTINTRPLLETDMETLLARYPFDLLGENLRCVGRQVAIGNYRLDLVFAKGPGRYVAVEVKRNPASRADITQVQEYANALQNQSSDDWWQVWLISPSIKPEFRTILRREGIKCREIPEERFVSLAREMGYL